MPNETAERVYYCDQPGCDVREVGGRNTLPEGWTRKAADVLCSEHSGHQWWPCYCKGVMHTEYALEPHEVCNQQHGGVWCELDRLAVKVLTTEEFEAQPCTSCDHRWDAHDPGGCAEDDCYCDRSNLAWGGSRPAPNPA